MAYGAAEVPDIEGEVATVEQAPRRSLRAPMVAAALALFALSATFSYRQARASFEVADFEAMVPTLLPTRPASTPFPTISQAPTPSFRPTTAPHVYPLLPTTPPTPAPHCVDEESPAPPADRRLQGLPSVPTSTSTPLPTRSVSAPLPTVGGGISTAPQPTSMPSCSSPTSPPMTPPQPASQPVAQP